jgi:hypothetical protein
MILLLLLFTGIGRSLFLHVLGSFNLMHEARQSIIKVRLVAIELMDDQLGEVLRKCDEISHRDDHGLETFVENLSGGIYVGLAAIFCEAKQ